MASSMNTSSSIKRAKVTWGRIVALITALALVWHIFKSSPSYQW